MQNKVYEKYEEVQAVEKQMIDALETRLREDDFSLNDLDVSSAMALHESIETIDPTG